MNVQNTRSNYLPLPRGALMPSSTSTSYDRLRMLLRELFQFDRADLDFGIYRVMNQRREQISQFLDQDLLPQVRDILATLNDDESQRLQRELEQVHAGESAIGVPRGSSQRAKELEAQLAAGKTAVDREADVYSDLYTFFSRYYDEGDFISQRRYKDGVYAIPYEGEEVKLHWANADQYYVKTTEDFQDYRFKLSDGRHAHFRLVAADIERDNNKAENGKERRFVLRQNNPVREVDGELELYFEYRPSADKQAEINAQSTETILKDPNTNAWRDALCQPSGKDKTLLEKHLHTYTSKNTFDYFIHKDLGSFLRRELDFFLKNEVAHLDDLDGADAPQAEQYLARLRAIRRIGSKIIDFLAQLEDFQKQLYLKKKFVLETNYLITLDRIPESLYGGIIANDAQWDEWSQLYGIDSIQTSRDRESLLASHPHLVLDTKWFNHEFTQPLVSTLEDLERSTDGILIKGDNRHALTLLENAYRERVQFTYIDPPYKADPADLPYKDDYPRSTWITLISDRLSLARTLMPETGLLAISIDETELAPLTLLAEDLFQKDNTVSTMIWNTEGHSDNQFDVKINHEYVHIIAKNRKSASIGFVIDPNTREESNLWKGYAENSITKNGRANPPSEVTLPPGFPLTTDAINLSSNKLNDDFFEQVKSRGFISRDTTRRFNVEYPIRLDAMIGDNGQLSAQCRVYSGWANVRKLRTFIDGGFKPMKEPDGEVSFFLSERGVIYYRKTRERARNIYFVLRNMGTTEQISSELEHMRLDFPYPKPKQLMKYLVDIGSGDSHVLGSEGVVLDFFAGSGTTGQAVIELNRRDKSVRRLKYILIEMGDYFTGTLKPRIAKAIYSWDWLNEKPTSPSGTSQIVKYLALESYEDSLSNIDLHEPTAPQQAMLETTESLREDYILRYILDAESADCLLYTSPSPRDPTRS